MYQINEVPQNDKMEDYLPNQNSTLQKEDQILIDLTFGDNSNDKKLLEISFELESKDENSKQKNIEEMRAIIRAKQLKQDDMIVAIKFSVTPGREEEAIDYLQKAFEQDNTERINPLQSLIKKPKTNGRMEIEQQKGLVIVYYYIYNEYLVTDEEMKQNFVNVFEDLRKNGSKIQSKIIVLGQEINEHKQKTNISASYIKTHLSLTKIKPNILFKFLEALQLIVPEANKYFGYTLLKRGLKRIKLSLNINSWKKIRQMYKRIVDKVVVHLPSFDEPPPSQLEFHSSVDSYVCKNLLKKKIEVEMYWKTFGIGKGLIEFQTQKQFQKILSFLIKPIKDILKI